jgi:hypothetical protein
LFTGGIPTASPTSPVYGTENHEWKQFTEDTSVYGFGNPLTSNPMVISWITFITDSPEGD